jgi:predicted anti-sigma-YlaC factor YlaD
MGSGVNHLSDRELEGYRARALTSSELLHVDDHLQVCESCYERFSASGAPTGVFEFPDEGAPEPDYAEDPLYVYLESYVDGQLQGHDLAMFESHLSSCPSCASEARALKDLRAKLSREGEITPKEKRAPIRLRAAYVWKNPRKRLALGLAAAFICILGLVLAAIVMIGNQFRALRSQIATLQQEAAERQQANSEQSEIAAQLAELRQRHDQLLDLYQSQARELDELKHRDAGAAFVSGKRNAPTMGTALSINDGSHAVKLDPNGRVTGLGSLPDRYRELVKAALESGRPKTPTRLKLDEMGGTSMGESPDSESFRVVSPVGVAVLDDRPILKWRALADVANYTVTISDSGFKQIVSGVATTDNWTPPQPLPPGCLYYWQVRTVRDGKEIVAPPVTSPPARFLVLGARDLDQLKRARQEHSDSHLLLGVIYARLGLIDNSIEEFQALHQQNPGSAVIQQILNFLGSMHR